MPTNVILSQVPTVEKVQQAEQQKSNQMQQDSALREGEESRRRSETVRTSPESERAKPIENEREEKKNATKKRKNLIDGETGEEEERDGRVEAEAGDRIVDVII
ncbi:MAG: hypothetical protein JRD68_06910 [Deltaproteobacteria bacterium]|nr:hypothetical protein [Deltaproteobacteria bacterium]